MKLLSPLNNNANNLSAPRDFFGIAQKCSRTEISNLATDCKRLWGTPSRSRYAPADTSLNSQIRFALEIMKISSYLEHDNLIIVANLNNFNLDLVFKAWNC